MERLRLTNIILNWRSQNQLGGDKMNVANYVNELQIQYGEELAEFYHTYNKNNGIQHRTPTR